MKLSNKAALDKWLFEKQQAGRAVVAVKGAPPAGAKYGDGTPITRPINIGWQDTSSGEIFAMEYDC